MRIHDWNRGVVNTTIDEFEARDSVDTGEHQMFRPTRYLTGSKEPRLREPMSVAQPVGGTAQRECFRTIFLGVNSDLMCLA
jgi:hypothetical protein